jgi:hypothetical protein
MAGRLRREGPRQGRGNFHLIVGREWELRPPNRMAPAATLLHHLTSRTPDHTTITRVGYLQSNRATERHRRGSKARIYISFWVLRT